MPLIKMERYTLQQRIKIVKIHYKNGENFAKTVRKVKKFLGRREAPSRPAIVKLVQKFEPGLYIPRRSLKLGISQTTIHRIL